MTEHAGRPRESPSNDADEPIVDLTSIWGGVTLDLAASLAAQGCACNCCGDDTEGFLSSASMQVFGEDEGGCADISTCGTPANGNFAIRIETSAKHPSGESICWCANTIVEFPTYSILCFHDCLGEEPGHVLVEGNNGTGRGYTDDGAGGYSAMPGNFNTFEGSTGGPYKETQTNGAVTYFNTDGQAAESVARTDRVTSYTYDHTGLNLETAHDSFTGLTTYFTSEDMHVESIHDWMGRRTYFDYDASGNMVKTKKPGGCVIAMSYDGALPTVVTDGDGFTTYYAYDGSDRLSVRQRVGVSLEQVTYYNYVSDRTQTVIRADGTEVDHLQDASGRVIKTAWEDYSGERKYYDANFQLIAVQDGRGNRTQYQYDATGNQTLTVDALGNPTYFEYDTNNDLISQRDALFRTTYFGYDDKGMRNSVIDPLAQVSYFNHDSKSYLVAAIDALERTTYYDYNEFGYRDLQIDALQNVTYFNRDVNYDGQGGVREVTIDPRLAVTTYEYNAADELTDITDALSGTEERGYDSRGHLTLVIDKLGNPTYYEYDGFGNLQSQMNSVGGNAVLTYYHYDLLNRRTAEIDPNGDVTYFQYDSADRLVATIDPVEAVTYFDYDKSGNQNIVIDPVGNVIRTLYDELNRVQTATSPAGETVASVYDEVGNLVTRVDPREGATILAYDELDRQIALTDPANGTTYFHYDKVGNQITVIDPKENVSYFHYDALDRQTVQIDAAGGVTYFWYDSVGNLIATVDAEETPTYYEYDLLNRQTEVKDVLGGPTAITYDAMGRQTIVVDPLSNPTYFQYDELGRQLLAKDALGGVTYFHYDPAGQLTVQIDPSEQPTYFEYDKAGRQIVVTDALGNFELYTYDLAGNRTRVLDASGNPTYFHYDPGNRLVISERPITPTYAPVPRGFIDGLVTSNDTDTDHDIQVAAGQCRDATDHMSISLSAAITKQIDADWAEGDDKGGFPSALTLAADTWYHVFVIASHEKVDAGFDTSLTASNLRADATEFGYYRRVGSVLTDGSSNITQFLQEGDDFLFADPIASDASATITATPVSLSLSLPPLRTRALLSASCSKAYWAARISVYSPEQDDNDRANLYILLINSGTTDIDQESYIEILTNSSAQIRAKASDSAVNSILTINTRGWRDFRGRE